MINYIE